MIKTLNLFRLFTKISYLYLTRKHLRDSDLIDELFETFKKVYTRTVPLSADTLDFMEKFAFTNVPRVQFPDFVIGRVLLYKPRKYKKSGMELARRSDNSTRLTKYQR